LRPVHKLLFVGHAVIYGNPDCRSCNTQCMKNTNDPTDEKRKFALDLARAIAKMIAAEDYAMTSEE